MRGPLGFVAGNLLFAPSKRDVWALYRLDTLSYPGLPLARKLEVKNLLEGFAYGVGADFQIVRVNRTWSVEEYIERARSTLSPSFGHPAMWDEHLAEHRELLAGRRTTRAEVYLSVSLRDASDDLSRVIDKALSGTGESLWATISGALGLFDARGVGRAELARLHALESRCYERVFGFLDCERASSDEVQWLVRRSYTRGLGEPRCDARWRPQALSFLDGEGQERFEPFEADLLRLHDSRVEVGPRGLRVDSELGRGYQAMLVVGALPEQVLYPGPEAELMFAPFENCPFPVDCALSVEWVPNRQALALARRRKVDADNLFSEESHGEHGPSSETAERPHQARELEQTLSGTDRPPLLLAALTLAVGAEGHEELEQRVARLRDEFGQIELHRPLGEQHRIFLCHLPAQRFPIRDFKDHLLVEQVGAMVPIADHYAGSEFGPYIGYTLSEARRPIQFDLSEASRQSRPPTVLMAGTLGSGKTMALQSMLYQAFLQGSRIVDVDPKQDHNLDRLPGVEDHHEEIELTGSERWRGLLDPLRISAPEIVYDTTVDFLLDLVRDPPRETTRAIQEAVKAVLAHAAHEDERPALNDVLSLLDEGDEHAADAARSLRVHADTGLAQLGFGSREKPAPDVGHAQVVSLRIRHLPLPTPGTPRGELKERERIGQAILRLVALYAMHLMGGERSEHKALGMDEAWFLLQDADGRRLIEQLARWGRSENATSILVTHLVADAESIDNLIGSRFVFGMESEEEARQALRLLRLDPEDSELRGRLLAFRKGRCLFRDVEGQVATIRIDPGPRLLRALDTTPRGDQELVEEDQADESLSDPHAPVAGL